MNLSFLPTSPQLLSPVRGPFTAPRTPRAPKWTCAGPRKRARRKKPVRAPPTQSKRTILNEPLTVPTRLQPISKPGSGPSADLVGKTLKSRRDAIVTGAGLFGKISAALSARETSEPALVLLPTREEALRASLEAQHEKKRAAVIVAAGIGHGSFRNAAMNANSHPMPVIVVGTVRAVFRAFLRDGHGPPWLAKVKFLVVGGLDDILETGCERELKRILRLIPEVSRRKNVVIVREVTGIVEDFMKGIVRPNVETVEWEAKVMKETVNDEARDEPLLGKHRLVSTSARGVLGEIERLVDVDKRTVVFFQAARLAELYAELIRERGVDVVDAHNKSSIGKRERALEMINKGGCILFASDFLTGVTIPPLDVIIQVGFVNEDSYKRRVQLLGKDGCAMMITAGYETESAKKLLKLEEVSGMDKGTIEGGIDVPDVVEKTRRVGYVSWMKFYMTVKKKLGWSKEEVVKFGNEWAMGTIGEIPVLDRKTVNHLLLRNVEGIRVE